MDDDNVQTDAEIVSEFEELFGGSSDEDEHASEESEEKETEDEDESDDTSDKDEDTDEDESDESKDKDSKEKKSKKPEEDPNLKKQREAFYKLRTKNKASDALLKRLGKVFNLDMNGSPEDIAAKIEGVLLEKEAKDSNIPVDVYKRLQQLEQQVQQNESAKVESTVTSTLTELAEEFNLDQAALEDFLFTLDGQGKNPLEVPNIDIKGEYLKLHYAELVDAAKASAVEEEKKRKEKVQDKAASTPPGKRGGGDTGKEIKTVSDLSSFFDSLDK